VTALRPRIDPHRPVGGMGYHEWHQTRAKPEFTVALGAKARAHVGRRQVRRCVCPSYWHVLEACPHRIARCLTILRIGDRQPIEAAHSRLLPARSPSQSGPWGSRCQGQAPAPVNKIKQKKKKKKQKGEKGKKIEGAETQVLAGRATRKPMVDRGEPASDVLLHFRIAGLIPAGCQLQRGRCAFRKSMAAFTFPILRRLTTSRN